MGFPLFEMLTLTLAAMGCVMLIEFCNILSLNRKEKDILKKMK